MAVIPYSSRLAPLGRFARRMALLATFMNDTMACQPLLLYHTCAKKVDDVLLLTYNVSKKVSEKKNVSETADMTSSESSYFSVTYSTVMIILCCTKKSLSQ